MSKRVKVGVLLLILIFNLLGCAGKTEVDELGIVNFTAVDIDDKTGDYEIIVQITKPQPTRGQRPGGPQIWTVSATGETLMKASRNLRAEFSKRLVWFHSNIIAISNKVARQGLENVIDFFASNQEIRYNSWVLVTKDLERVLKVSPRFDNSLAQGIEGIINNYQEWGSTYALNLKDLLIRLGNPQYDEVTARLTNYIPKHPPEGTYQQENLVKDLPKDDKRTIGLEGMGVFKDGKLVTWFNRVDTRGYLWITGKMKRGTVVVPVENKGTMSVDILQSSSQLQPKLEDGKVKFKLQIKTAVRISEKIPQLDLTKLKNVAKAEKLIAKEIEKEVEAALEKAQQYNVDIFGFCNYVYRTYPHQWETLKQNWDQIYPVIVLDTKIEVKIKRLGMTSKTVMD